MATGGRMLAAAVAAIRSGIIYVVRPDGEIEEVAICAWDCEGQPKATRAAAEAAALRITNRN